MTRFDQFWVLAAVAAVAQFAWAVDRRRRSGRPLNPQPPSGNVLYKETFASGHSLKTTWSRMVWTKGCLRVVITPEVLWVAPFFPFNLAPGLHLEYDIARSAIVAINPAKYLFRKTVVIEFKDATGGVERLELLIRDPKAFLTALG